MERPPRSPRTHFASLRHFPPPGKRPLTLPSPPGRGNSFPPRLPVISHVPLWPRAAFFRLCGALPLREMRSLVPSPGGEGRVRGLFARGYLKDALFPIRALVEKRKTHPCLAHTFLGRLSSNGRGIRTCAPFPFSPTARLPPSVPPPHRSPRPQGRLRHKADEDLRAPGGKRCQSSRVGWESSISSRNR